MLTHSWRYDLWLCTLNSLEKIIQFRGNYKQERHTRVYFVRLFKEQKLTRWWNTPDRMPLTRVSETADAFMQREENNLLALAQASAASTSQPKLQLHKWDNNDYAWPMCVCISAAAAKWDFHYVLICTPQKMWIKLYNKQFSQLLVFISHCLIMANWEMLSFYLTQKKKSPHFPFVLLLETVFFPLFRYAMPNALNLM